ncbi:hypothetical protein AtNW77_Chr1g0033481 [Arabidopsis thaliana]|uniref:At1g30260/F12P21_9 n=4 Tax=Arabidopsis TaxID=3701 RepID=Q9C754_ARATH|nr:galactosyltransferase family protein [Arabidopsis thaliana]KAG7648009.1 hypothetical protein ISN45_At01g030020 [Arabidopsis thaliana x Arabidopsis arenosa]KAG7655934.1 hypothetical protein ISN44_As01g029660 [Arabidopsis suecica]AAG50559.1 hypothetical protein [Arabidopsis thaliana]AAL15326.1 At1g30260/F12P21_9 [Arabidopsis thaliana]AAM51581.1 At1g30260/F12P21_9 [Arabidopsis thaliana]|eukprot:NP_564352.1 galactosyltransferase family protein [Arabidopsis thaliana]
MATSRLARFITEVAPPQFVTVMRRRTAKVLDTIKEEEREVGTDSIFPSSFNSKKISSPFTSPYSSSVSSASASASCTSGLNKFPVTENRGSFPVFKN